jgi:hypothetical protein
MSPARGASVQVCSDEAPMVPELAREAEDVDDHEVANGS